MTSCEPERDDCARLPCLATTTPAPATRNAAIVETLTDREPSPPVPQVSTIGSGAEVDADHAGAHRPRRADDLVDRLALHPQRDQQAADLGRRRLSVHDLADHLGHLVGGQVRGDR